MGKNQQTAEPQAENFNRIIVLTAVKTLAVLLAVIIFVFALFLWVAPASAGNFFYKMGMEEISVRFTYRAAQNQKTFDAWYASLVRAVGTDSFEITYNSAKQLEAYDDGEKDYAKLITEKDITVDGTKYSAKHYVAYHKVRAGVRHFREENLEAFWNTAVEWTKAAKKFESDLTPMKGYLVAITEDTSIEVDETEFMAILEEIFSKNTYLDFWISNKDQKRDFAVYTVNLMNARGWTIDKAKWNSRIMDNY